MLEIGVNGEQLYINDTTQMGMATAIRLPYDSLVAEATGEMAL